MRIFTLASTLFALAACAATQPPVTEIDCTGSGTMVGAIDALADDVVTGDITLKGTARHEDNLTIRSMFAGSLFANNDGFNFDFWSLPLPFDQLLRDADEDLQVSLDVTAEDACGEQAVLGTVVLQLDPDPDPEVTDFEITVSTPGGVGYLPKDGVTTAVVEVSSNVEGELVTLSSDIGTFQPRIIPLVNTGFQGEAFSLFSAAESGVATLRAEVLDEVVETELIVAGPPIFLPAVATVEAGKQLLIVVESAGSVASCSAEAPSDWIVNNEFLDLTTSEGALDSDGDGRVQILIDVPDDASFGSAAITCEDDFGQSTTHEYDLAF